MTKELKNRWIQLVKKSKMKLSSMKMKSQSLRRNFLALKIKGKYEILSYKFEIQKLVIKAGEFLALLFGENIFI